MPILTEPLVPLRRPLTAAEKRLLRAKARSLAARGRRATPAALVVGAAGILLLWAWTIVASDAPWTVITAFWLVAGSVIVLWVRRDLRRDGRQLEQTAGRLESALRRNAADVYDIRASRFAELAEVEDEGACWAFELEGERLVFLTGQEFYEGAGFPSLDFSLVYVLDEHGDTVEMLIDKRAPKAAPFRTIPAGVKQTLPIPDHLHVCAGTVARLEAALGGPSSGPA